MKHKRLLASILAISMLASTSVPAFASEQNEVTDLPSNGYSDMTLEVTNTSGGGSDIIIVEVPAELPIVMDQDGNITVPTNASIINHVEDKSVKVTSINAALASEWSAANYSDDFTTKAENTKELGLSFRGDAMDTTGNFNLSADNWTIAANSELPLDMGAKLPKQPETAKFKIATIGFTFDWEKEPEPERVTITFTTDGNGTLEGETTVTINSGDTATFPTPIAGSTYSFSKWVNAETNEEVNESTAITSDMTIKAEFILVYSPAEWFATSGSALTGLSDIGLNAVNNGNTDLVIPEVINGVTITSIKDHAFYAANRVENYEIHNKITSVVIPNTVTSIGADTFTWCLGITKITLPKDLKQINDSTFYGCLELREISSIENVTYIGDSAFRECRYLSLVIPDAVTYIGVSAFINLPHIAYHGPATGAPWGAKAMN